MEVHQEMDGFESQWLDALGKYEKLKLEIGLTGTAVLICYSFPPGKVTLMEFRFYAFQTWFCRLLLISAPIY